MINGILGETRERFAQRITKDLLSDHNKKGRLPFRVKALKRCEIFPKGFQAQRLHLL